MTEHDKEQWQAINEIKETDAKQSTLIAMLEQSQKACDEDRKAIRGLLGKIGLFALSIISAVITYVMSVQGRVTSLETSVDKMSIELKEAKTEEQKYRDILNQRQNILDALARSNQQAIDGLLIEIQDRKDYANANTKKIDELVQQLNQDNIKILELINNKK